MNEELILVRGSAGPIDILLVDQNSTMENLIGVDRATFTVRDSASAVPILDRSTADATLSVDTVSGKLVATLDSVEAEDLVEGNYIGEIALRFGDDDHWVFSERFFVKVLKPIATKV